MTHDTVGNIWLFQIGDIFWCQRHGQSADRILVMEQGQLAESGTHKELLAEDGIYAGLYRRQFNKNDDAARELAQAIPLAVL